MMTRRPWVRGVMWGLNLIAIAVIIGIAYQTRQISRHIEKTIAWLDEKPLSGLSEAHRKLLKVKLECLRQDFLSQPWNFSQRHLKRKTVIAQMHVMILLPLGHQRLDEKIYEEWNELYRQYRATAWEKRF